MGERNGTHPVRGATPSSAPPLSVTAVENEFVERVYAKLAKVYDLTFGPTLHYGRLQAIERLGVRAGQDVLEVGIGTGINIALYPPDCRVVGIDVSEQMLEKAQERIDKRGIRNVELHLMDAAELKFPDDSFDIVYAPYVMSVVPDPVKVAGELRRVCRSGGRIVLLNHFKSTNKVIAAAERWISPLTVHIGFKADLDLPAFLAQADLQPVSIEKVNLPPMWSLVTCVKD